MPLNPASRADILEREFEAATTLLIRGIIVLVVSLILVWILRLAGLLPLAAFFALTALAGAVIVAVAGRRMYLARKVPALTVYCPYCQHPNQFVEEPAEDWTCEGCHRTVYYENGQMVPVREITCPSCRTVHKVSQKAKTFTCDRCNRTLRLTDPSEPAKIVAEPTDMLRNYDVILTQAGRQPNDVAMALQDILVCNLKEAKARMQDLPLTIVRNVPERKADAIRSRLRELGATAVIRPTEDEQAARPRRP